MNCKITKLIGLLMWLDIQVHFAHEAFKHGMATLFRVDARLSGSLL